MAGRIPQGFVDDLLSRVDIVEVIDEHVPLKRAGQDYQACCPFHQEKTPSVQTRQGYGTEVEALIPYHHAGGPIPDHPAANIEEIKK